ncbi:hypothetical protein [Rhodoglobus sp.]
MTARRVSAGRFIAAVSAMVLVAATITGCSQETPVINADAASRMQASVAAITQAAAVGDPEGALVALDALEAQLTLDTESGAINAERSARIQSIIDLVRADLTAALPEPAPSPTPTQDEKGGKGNKKDDEDKGNKNGKDD